MTNVEEAGEICIIFCIGDHSWNSSICKFETLSFYLFILILVFGLGTLADWCKGRQIADCSLHESLLCQESMTNAEAWEILICFGIGYHSWNSRTSKNETFSKHCSFSSLAAFWSGWVLKKQGRRNLASGMVIMFATRNKENYNNKIIEFSVHLVLFIQLLLLADGCHGLAAFWSGWLIKKQGRRMCFRSGGGKVCNNRKQVKQQVKQQV